MPRPVTVPRDLTYAPFDGRQAISDGLLTRRQLSN
jgi:hypothetical protein